MEDTSSLSELLQPSLKDRQCRRQPLSDTASFLISFVGGGPAAILVGVFNARRMGRRASDGPLAVALFVLWALFSVFFARSLGADDLPEWLAHQSARRRVQQAAGLLVCGVFFLVQRSTRRAAALLDGPAPRPWVPGLVMILVSYGLIGVVLWAGGGLG